MPRLVIPITGKILFTTGDVRLWAEVDLELRDHLSNWWPARFRLDTATDISTMSAYEAKQIGLPVPKNPILGAVHQPTGLEIRAGLLRFRVPGLDQTEFMTSVLFLGSVDVAPILTSSTLLPRRLLQPFSLLNDLRFSMDNNGTTPFGEVVIEKK